MSKLVIAEKPMLARDIARAITGKEVSESARLPISGNGYTVCACAGHLLELVKPDSLKLAIPSSPPVTRTMRGSLSWTSFWTTSATPVRSSAST